jgi:hypothetical protein
MSSPQADREWLIEQRQMSAQAGMSEIEPLALVVIIDKEPHRTP